MKTICYVVPFFGKFDKGFPLWLKSCGNNDTVNWLIITDDKRLFQYPKNVKVIYSTFEDLKKKIQSFFDFKICLDRPYKLCDFRPAYGLIFSDYLEKFDFWGHCDTDLIWGNIRQFYTDEILEQYEKISQYGPSTLYSNSQKMNYLFKKEVPGFPTFKEVFSSTKSFAFDEAGITRIVQSNEVKFFDCQNFANLDKYNYGFYLCDRPDSEKDRNKHQIFSYENGKILRHYLLCNHIFSQEFIYLHYWCRPISFKIHSLENTIWFYPEMATDKIIELNSKNIKKFTRRNPFRYYFKSIWRNRKKLSLKRIVFNIKGKISYNKKHK